MHDPHSERMSSGETRAASGLALVFAFRMLGMFMVLPVLATYGMAKGWVEFWLIWVAVDVVGVPLLWSAGYYASAFMYLFYGVFTLIGFFVWLRAKANEKPQVETVMPDPTLQ